MAHSDAIPSVMSSQENPKRILQSSPRQETKQAKRKKKLNFRLPSVGTQFSLFFFLFLFFVVVVVFFFFFFVDLQENLLLSYRSFICINGCQSESEHFNFDLVHASCGTMCSSLVQLLINKKNAKVNIKLNSYKKFLLDNR